MSKLIMLGDSIAAGAFCEDGGWATKFCNHILSLSIKGKNNGNGFYLFPYNLSVSGNYVVDTIQRFDNEVNARIDEDDNKSAFIIALGTNDSVLFKNTMKPKFSDEEYLTNLGELVGKCRKFTNKIFIVGQVPIHLEELNKQTWHDGLVFSQESVKHFNNLNKKFCDENNIKFINIYNDFNDYIYLLDDGLHPNKKGHDIIYNKVKDAVIDEDFINYFIK